MTLRDIRNCALLSNTYGAIFRLTLGLEPQTSGVKDSCITYFNDCSIMRLFIHAGFLY
jgi:hypothetical protein